MRSLVQAGSGLRETLTQSDKGDRNQGRHPTSTLSSTRTHPRVNNDSTYTPATQKQNKAKQTRNPLKQKLKKENGKPSILQTPW